MLEENKSWFTLKQTAKELNLSDRTIKKHIATGKLKRRLVGRKNLIHKLWIYEFVCSHGGQRFTKTDKEEMKRLLAFA